jgi:hypothetical protein
MVSASATGHKVRGFKPCLGEGILRKVKTHSTPSFGEKVKPEAPRLKILSHVKNNFISMKKILRKVISINSFARSSCLLLQDPAGSIARNESGISFCRYYSTTVLYAHI